MTLFWIPDTCFCAFYVKDDFSSIEKIIQRCELHKDTAESILLKTVQGFNKYWNDRAPTTPTKEQIDILVKEKFDEKMKTKRTDV